MKRRMRWRKENKKMKNTDDERHAGNDSDRACTDMIMEVTMHSSKMTPVPSIQRFTTSLNLICAPPPLLLPGNSIFTLFCPLSLSGTCPPQLWLSNSVCHPSLSAVALICSFLIRPGHPQ